MALLTSHIFLDIGVLLLTLLGAAYLYLSRNYKTWEKKGIPYLKPSPFVGNFIDVVLSKKSMNEIFEDAHNLDKKQPLLGVFAFDQPMLLVRDLEFVKNILVKDFNYFKDRNFNTGEKADPLTARTLFAMKGQPWRHMRIKLSPAFTSGKMKRMFTFLDECGKELINYVDKYSVDGRIEVRDTMARYTTDVIASCAFGIQGNALRESDSEFRQILSKIFNFSIVKGIKFTLSFTSPRIISALNLRVLDVEVEKYVRNTIWSTVEYRKKNNIVRNDFLDLLIQMKETGSLENETANTGTAQEGQKVELEGDDFVGQAYQFIVAGFETSATTMSFALYEMAVNSDIQVKARQEIQSVLEKNEGKVTYDMVQEMTYLDMVLAEALRKYPILGFLDRIVQQPYTIPGTNVQLEKGDIVVISVSGIQHDPEYYPNPDVFDPERFTEENKRLRPNYTYMPFGEGPRNCIGMRLGLLQAKVGIVHFLSHFEISPCKDTKIPLDYDKRSFLTAPNGVLPLAVRRIKVAP